MRALISTVYLSGLLTCAGGSAWCAEKDVAMSRSETSVSRTLDDVRRVIDKNKGSFYALFARAARDKPGLRGEIVLSFSIAPDGTVTKCAVASSTLHHPELEGRIIERFSAIKFGAKGRNIYINPGYPLTFVSM